MAVDVAHCSETRWPMELQEFWSGNHTLGVPTHPQGAPTTKWWEIEGCGQHRTGFYGEPWGSVHLSAEMSLGQKLVFNK